MSKYESTYEEIRSLILEKFDLVLSMVIQRKEDLLNQLQKIYSNFKSSIDSKLKTMQELEQMRDQMEAFYTQQNRASQVQKAALFPINKEIKSIEESLNLYELHFKIDTNLVETLVCDLGEIVEPVYNTIATPPALPPRPLSAYKSKSYKESAKACLPTPAVKKSISLSRQPTPEMMDEVEFTTVIPRVASTPQITSPSLRESFSLSSFSNKLKPIFASCDRGYEPQELVSPMGMVYNSRDNCIYIVDQLLHKILVLSSNGEYIMEFGSDVLTRPNSIAISKNTCCVSDEALNGIVSFDLCSSVMTGKVVSFPQGAGAGELSIPKGIDFDAKNFLYIADSDNDRICIMDENLSIKMVFNGPFRSPQDVKISHGVIYVLDCNASSCIHVFALSGTLIRSIIPSQRDVSSPNFFCLDLSGHLLLSDGATNRVSVFSLDGKPVCIVGEDTNAWEDGINCLTGVCVTKDNKVVCAFSKGESVICFY